MSSPDAALRIMNLTKTFRRGNAPLTAVDNVSFHLLDSEILGLLGPNGAGKTTIIRMLISTLKPTSGSIEYFGKCFSSNRSQILQRVAFASTYTHLPLFLTVRENLDIHGRLYGLDRRERKERSEELLSYFSINNLQDQRFTQLSAGQRTMVMLVKAFLTRPRIALLDEPTASLDPDVTNLVRSFVAEQRLKHSVAILYTSHNMTDISELCDRVIFLMHGKIVAVDTPQALAASVALSKLRLAIEDGLQRLLQSLKNRCFAFTLDGKEITISLPEPEIPGLIVEMVEHGCKFTRISIEAPSLEDYFLQVANR